ncbi:MAG: DUF1624 domain-containing protein [Gammaproteobacteria bacterium]|nr:DUF1624 domain-containing protein [Gammaproteobacteria bacterium]
MSATPQQNRYQIIDVLRGVAILMMFSFHFSFDLNYYGFIQQDFYNSLFWTNYRSVIVSSFLVLVGVSLYLATRNGIKPQSYFKRLGLLVLFASLVSVASYIQFPESMIFFGILHFIAAASILGPAFTRFYWLNLVLGIALIMLGTQFQHTFFNQPLWQWFGLMTHKPVTEDYVPLLPWFGMILIGLFLGKFIYQYQHLPVLRSWKSKHPVFRSLTFAGKHSLIIYMLHQPIFMGLLYIPYSLNQ